MPAPSHLKRGRGWHPVLNISYYLHHFGETVDKRGKNVLFITLYVPFYENSDSEAAKSPRKDTNFSNHYDHHNSRFLIKVITSLSDYEPILYWALINYAGIILRIIGN